MMDCRNNKKQTKMIGFIFELNRPLNYSLKNFFKISVMMKYATEFALVIPAITICTLVNSRFEGSLLFIKKFKAVP